MKMDIDCILYLEYHIEKAKISHYFPKLTTPIIFYRLSGRIKNFKEGGMSKGDLQKICQTHTITRKR